MKTKTITAEVLNANSSYTSSNLSFQNYFNDIILNKIEDYSAPERFFTDLQRGGCISGMIGKFIYHSDCKEFYIEHLDDLEWLKSDMEDQLGESIQNRDNLPHYTFMCWLCFEEYCYNIYTNLFEN